MYVPPAQQEEKDLHLQQKAVDGGGTHTRTTNTGKGKEMYLRRVVKTYISAERERYALATVSRMI